MKLSPHEQLETLECTAQLRSEIKLCNRDASLKAMCRMQPRYKDRYETISTPNPIAAMRKLSATGTIVPLSVQRRKRRSQKMVMFYYVSDLADVSFVSLTGRLSLFVFMVIECKILFCQDCICQLKILSTKRINILIS